MKYDRKIKKWEWVNTIIQELQEFIIKTDVNEQSTRDEHKSVLFAKRQNMILGMSQNYRATLTLLIFKRYELPGSWTSLSLQTLGRSASTFRILFSHIWRPRWPQPDQYDVFEKNNRWSTMKIFEQQFTP